MKKGREKHQIPSLKLLNIRNLVKTLSKIKKEVRNTWNPWWISISNFKWRRVQDLNLRAGISRFDGFRVRCITTLPTLRVLLYFLHFQPFVKKNFNGNHCSAIQMRNWRWLPSKFRGGKIANIYRCNCFDEIFRQTWKAGIEPAYPKISDEKYQPSSTACSHTFGNQLNVLLKDCVPDHLNPPVAEVLLFSKNESEEMYINLKQNQFVKDWATYESFLSCWDDCMKST